MSGFDRLNINMCILINKKPLEKKNNIKVRKDDSGYM